MCGCADLNVQMCKCANVQVENTFYYDGYMIACCDVLKGADCRKVIANAS